MGPLNSTYGLKGSVARRVVTESRSLMSKTRRIFCKLRKPAVAVGIFLTLKGTG